MNDPQTSTATDGGLNSSDTQDWNTGDNRIRIPWYLSAGAIVLVGGVLFLIAVIGIKVSGMMQAKPAAVSGSATVVATAPAATDKDAEIANLRRQLALLQAPAPGTPAAVAQPPVYTADPTALAALSARLDRVEANQRALAHAAMVANAAAAMSATARSGAPFASQLIALEPALNDATLVAPLKAYADKGVPTTVDLAVRYRAAAAAANIAGKADTGDKGLLARSLRGLGSLLHLSIRRTDNTSGQGTEALLQLAENRVNSGDLTGAVAYLDTLKPAAHKAMEPWLAEARARLLVDDTTDRITASALSRLAQVNADPAVAQPGASL